MINSCIPSSDTCSRSHKTRGHRGSQESAIENVSQILEFLSEKKFTKLSAIDLSVHEVIELFHRTCAYVSCLVPAKVFS